jgi:hypothetical protein
MAFPVLGLCEVFGLDTGNPESCYATPQGTGWSEDRFPQSLVSWSSGKAYRICFATEFDFTSTPFTPIFGVARYDLATKAFETYIDLLETGSGGCNPNWDDLISFQYLHGSFEAFGADMFLIINEQDTKDGASTRTFNAIVLNGTDGTVICDQELSTYGINAGNSYNKFDDTGLLIPVNMDGENGATAWYLVGIDRHTTPSATFSSDVYLSVLEVNAASTSSATFTEQDHGTFITTLTDDYSERAFTSTARLHTDGFDLWFYCFATTGSTLTDENRVSHIRFVYPYETPTINDNVLSYALDNITESQFYSLHYQYSVEQDKHYLIHACLVDEISTFTRFRGWSFDGTFDGPFTLEWTVDHTDFNGAGNIATPHMMSFYTNHTYGWTITPNTHENLPESVLIQDFWEDSLFEQHRVSLLNLVDGSLVIGSPESFLVFDGELTRFNEDQIVGTFGVTWQQSTKAEAANDQARVGYAFYNNSDEILDPITWADLVATTSGVWTTRTLEEVTVPDDCFYIRLYLEMAKLTGPDNDGYLDAIVAHNNEREIKIYSNFAGSGAFVEDWEIVSGTLAFHGEPPTAYADGQYYYGSTDNSTVVFQDLFATNWDPGPSRFVGGVAVFSAVQGLLVDIYTRSSSNDPANDPELEPDPDNWYKALATSELFLRRSDAPVVTVDAVAHIHML